MTSEIDEYQRRASGARSNHLQVAEHDRMTQDEVARCGATLSKHLRGIKMQDSRIAQVQNERDLGCRQVQAATEENGTLAYENRILSLGISELKTEIQEKDKLCVETHLKHSAIAAELVDLRRQCEDVENTIAGVNDHTTELRNKIQRARFLTSQAELDGRKQRQVLADIAHGTLGLTMRGIARGHEVALLVEKARTISGMLLTGDLAFRQQAQELEGRYESLTAEVHRLAELSARISHRRALQLEAIRVSKALLIEQGKVRALEDDLEKPLNVHRWRLLEGTNPELAQLIRMATELRERLMYKIFVLVRLKKGVKDVQANARVLDKHLGFAYTGNINEEITFLADALKQKARQLAVIRETVAGQTGHVSDHKGEVLTMRGMVREEKTGYYDTKKKVDEIRASSTMRKNGGKTVVASQGSSVYIGGGFAVAGVIRKDLRVKEDDTGMSPQPKKTAQGMLAGPQIVQPRSASMVQSKLPHGWNPARGALHPRLPTVSQIA
jgi:septal ring factor EnvC (AmiA/AmiB activator)